MKKTKVLNSIFRFAAVMIVMCILPSGVFASENKPVFIPADNITEENFADVQAEMLDSISEQITELQSFYSGVSNASNASDLQKVLSSQRCVPHGTDMGPGKMNNGPCAMPGLFDFTMVENVTDDNYTEVQAKMVSSIGNLTETLNGQLESTTDENMSQGLSEQVSDLENLSSKISSASSAEELQNVVFTYLQTQATDSIKTEIEHLEAIASENKNATDGNTSENLNSRITELNGLMEDISGAESLEDLEEIMSSSHGKCGMGAIGPMQPRGDFPMNHGRMAENHATNSTEA
jgi:hypothetical protein